MHSIWTGTREETLDIIKKIYFYLCDYEHRILTSCEYTVSGYIDSWYKRKSILVIAKLCEDGRTQIK